MTLSDEQIRNYQAKANLKEVVRGGNNEGKNRVTDIILAQDQYKQEIIDGLLEIRRKLVRMEDENGNTKFLQEFVRLEDGSGRWYPVSEIPSEKWKQIKSGGIVSEKGARRVLTHLNSTSNNNIIFGNLSQRQINQLGLNSAMSIDNLLRNNREEYGIQSTDEVEWIMNSMVNYNQMAALSKAKSGKMIGEALRNINLVGNLDEDEDDSGGGLLSGYGNG